MFFNRKGFKCLFLKIKFLCFDNMIIKYISYSLKLLFIKMRGKNKENGFNFLILFRFIRKVY